MKKLMILFFSVALFIACTDKKKEAEEKAVEKSIQKVDSLNTTIQKSAKELDEVVKEVEDVVKEVEDVAKELEKL